MERIVRGDDSNVECRSRIVNRDRYYWQEEKGSERGDEREKERKLKKRRGKSGYPLRVLKSSGRNTAETASPSSTRSATFAKNFHN